MKVTIDVKGKLGDCSFGVTGKTVCVPVPLTLLHLLYMLCTGLKLQGAQCRVNILSLTATILSDLPLTSLNWVRYVGPDIKFHLVEL